MTETTKHDRIFLQVCDGGMNQRQFAAAHDRYLEPPDEEFDDTTDDEMDLADIERQNQIDHEDWLAERLRQRQEDEQ